MTAHRFLALRSIATCVCVLAAAGAAAQDRGLEVAAYGLEPDATPGRQYAVFIAIDKYREWMPLSNPVKDAREIRDILVSRYWVDPVIELYDGQATKAGIFKLFDSLIRKTQPEDSVLIFYAGHGQLDPLTDTGFWIPADAGTDPYSQENWIPNVQVRNMIGKMKARHVALLSDSCFSGDMLNPSRGAPPRIDEDYFRKAYNRVSRQIITSGSSETVPDRSEFARQLKQVLVGNQRPYLDTLQIFSELRLGMGATTPLFGDFKDSGHMEGASFILFLREPKTAPQPAAGPTEASSAQPIAPATSRPAVPPGSPPAAAKRDGFEIALGYSGNTRYSGPRAALGLLHDFSPRFSLGIAIEGAKYADRYYEDQPGFSKLGIQIKTAFTAMKIRWFLQIGPHFDYYPNRSGANSPIQIVDSPYGSLGFYVGRFFTQVGWGDILGEVGTNIGLGYSIPY